MKKLIGITLSVLLLLLSVICSAPFAVSAAVVDSGITGDCTWSLDDNGTLTISGIGAMSDYQPYGPLGWYYAPPWYDKYVSKVIINSGVTGIGERAFDSCTILKTVNIPDSVETIGKYAFCDCSNLESVVIGDGVTSIEKMAFSYCGNLKSVTIPENVTFIERKAFGYYEYDYSFEVMPGFTIYGIKGTAAEKYANDNGIKFIEIQPEQNLKLGDANSDNSIDVLDAAAIQKYASGKADLTPEQLAAADVNGDYNVDVLDAAEIQKFAAGKITEFKKKA